MIKYEYRKGKFIKDGHTMLEQDVLKDLRRLAYLEEALANQKNNKSDSGIVMPRRLTAENGAKAFLMGEFAEYIELPNQEYCGCGECDNCISFPDREETILKKVPISWGLIKDMYAQIVARLGKDT